MTHRTPEFSVALTHVFKGVARFTMARTATHADPNHLRIDDHRRRTHILEKLYNDHALEIAELGGEFTRRETLPPDGWVNDRLTAMGERWRVQNVDGFRCEIYDAMS